jgi:hypothetical protein
MKRKKGNLNGTEARRLILNLEVGLSHKLWDLTRIEKSTNVTNNLILNSIRGTEATTKDD